MGRTIITYRMFIESEKDRLKKLHPVFYSHFSNEIKQIWSSTHYFSDASSYASNAYYPEKVLLSLLFDQYHQIEELKLKFLNLLSKEMSNHPNIILIKERISMNFLNLEYLDNNCKQLFISFHKGLRLNDKIIFENFVTNIQRYVIFDPKTRPTLNTIDILMIGFIVNQKSLNDLRNYMQGKMDKK